MGGGVFSVPDGSKHWSSDRELSRYRRLIFDFMVRAGLQTDAGGWLCCQANFPSTLFGFRSELVWLGRWMPINDGGGLIVAMPSEWSFYEASESWDEI